MFSCCSICSRCCCFSLSVLNLFFGLESSPNSLTAGFCEGLLGKERVPCPLGEPGPVLLVWLAGDLRAWSLLGDQQVGGSTRPYAPGSCPVGMGLKTPMPHFIWAELPGATPAPSRPHEEELMDSCWLHCKPPREPPALPQRGFWWRLVGFQHSWVGGVGCKAQPSAWRSSLSWGRAGTVPEEKHQISWTAKPKQQDLCSSLGCGLGQIGFAVGGWGGVWNCMHRPTHILTQRKFG